jgi:uncharacterized alkaline shock family protein YloU
VADVVRAATLGSYGVTGLRPRGLFAGRLTWLGGRPPISVALTPDRLEIEIRISVAYGAPVAEVARQVDSAIRFAVRQAVEREVDRVSIYVGELRVEPAAEPPAAGRVHRPTAVPQDDGTP